MATAQQSRFCTLPRPAIGRELKREDVNGGHVRLYLKDHRDCLRLILINDVHGHKHYVLTKKTLRQEFGASYQDLGLEATTAYKRMDDLDRYNQWPPVLYPEGQPVRLAAEPVAAHQPDDLRELAALPLAGAADAWI